MTLDMSEYSDDVRSATRCIVCLKTLSPDEARWTVHFRGVEHTVCCPSCVQLFNRSPIQFLERP